MATGVLVVSRKLDERIWIRASNGESICFWVCSVRGKTIRIGIQADEGCRVIREEAFNKEGTPRIDAAKESSTNRVKAQDRPLGTVGEWEDL